MSIILDIQTAFDNRLDALAGDTDVAWINILYTPTEGTAFIMPTLMLSASQLMDLNSNQLLQGIYRVSLFYPRGEGAGNILSKVDNIKNHFRSLETIESASASIYIKEISVLTSDIRNPNKINIDGAWTTAAVDINFKVYGT